jgi:hypothetical protein
MIRKVIEEGEFLPRGYGIAWYEPHRSRVVLYPIPLNWVMSFLRDAWWIVRKPPWVGPMVRYEMWRNQKLADYKFRADYTRHS